MLELHLDRRSGLPTYLQLTQQIEQALRLGMLVPGDQLPTAREVVSRLAINPNTVHKAYRELERAGLVEARPGKGTFVLRGLGNSPADVSPALRADLDRWMDDAIASGLLADDLRALFDTALRAKVGLVEGMT
ncbi:GntR family transcriptional regulator [Streptomyces sp. NPDC004838]